MLCRSTKSPDESAPTDANSQPAIFMRAPFQARTKDVPGRSMGSKKVELRMATEVLSALTEEEQSAQCDASDASPPRFANVLSANTK